MITIIEAGTNDYGTDDMTHKTQIIYKLDGRGGAVEVPPQELAAPADAQQGQPIFWLNLDITHPGARHILKDQAGLDHFAINALLADETRPRVVKHGNGLIAILRGVNLNPGAEPDDMVAVRIWVDEHRIITTRRRNLQSLVDLHEMLQKGDGPATTSEFLTRLADRLVIRIGTMIDTIEDNIADLEELSLTDEIEHLRSNLIGFRRETVGLRRYLAPMREALIQLQNETIPWFSQDIRLRIREIADRLVRLVEDLDLIRDRSALIHEELTARLSDQFNKRLYLLSIVAAIFLPLSFLTGLLGINVGGIPGSDYKWAFTIFVGFLAVIVIFLLGYFKKRKWL